MFAETTAATSLSLLKTIVDCAMEALLKLPNEILLRVLHYVDPVQISTFLSTLVDVIPLADNEQFWQSLAGTFGITCKQPYGSWKDLCYSGDLMATCPHLQAVDCPCSLIRVTSVIMQGSPCSCGQQPWACLEYGICLGNQRDRMVVLLCLCYPKDAVIAHHIVYPIANVLMLSC